MWCVLMNMGWVLAAESRSPELQVPELDIGTQLSLPTQFQHFGCFPTAMAKGLARKRKTRAGQEGRSSFALQRYAVAIK
jgi:hypothetical protein